MLDTNMATKAFDLTHDVSLYVYRCARLISVFYWILTGLKKSIFVSYIILKIPRLVGIPYGAFVI